MSKMIDTWKDVTKELPKKSYKKITVKVCADNNGHKEIWEEVMEFTYFGNKSYFAELDTGVLYRQQDNFCQFAECWDGKEEHWEVADDMKITHWKNER